LSPYRTVLRRRALEPIKFIDADGLEPKDHPLFGGIGIVLKFETATRVLAQGPFSSTAAHGSSKYHTINYEGTVVGGVFKTTGAYGFNIKIENRHPTVNLAASFNGSAGFNNPPGQGYFTSGSVNLSVNIGNTAIPKIKSTPFNPTFSIGYNGANNKIFLGAALKNFSDGFINTKIPVDLSTANPSSSLIYKNFDYGIPQFKINIVNIGGAGITLPEIKLDNYTSQPQPVNNLSPVQKRVNSWFNDPIENFEKKKIGPIKGKDIIKAGESVLKAAGS